MGAEVRVAELKLPIADAVRQKPTALEIDRLQIANAVERESRLRHAFGIKFPALWMERVMVAKPNERNAPTHGGIPEGSAIAVVKHGDAQPRLFDTRPIG